MVSLVPVPEIARQHGVSHVIEGSVRKAGDKVRITVQLIDTARPRPTSRSAWCAFSTTGIGQERDRCIDGPSNC